jgi:GT2 family glycosyltransferase
VNRRLAFPRRGLARVSRRLLLSARGTLSRRRRVAAFLEGRVARRPWIHRFVSSVALGSRVERYERWIQVYDTLSEGDVVEMRGRDLPRSESPLLFSLLVPLTGASEKMLEELLESIDAQVFDGWELLFVGVADDARTARFLQRTGVADGRTHRAAPLSASWSTVLDSVRGEFLVLLDPTVLLRPHALFAYARAIARDPDAAVIYADEDTIDESGVRSNHYFKPAWNHSLLECQNYLGGFVCVRRSVAEEVGTAPDEIDGSWGWSLFLRLSAEVDRGSVHHLPFVLHHRRPRTLAGADAATRLRATRSLEDRLARSGRQVRVEAVGEGSFRVRYAVPESQPSVSIIIPSTCDPDLLAPCIDGLVNRTSYANLDICVVANGTQRHIPERRRYLDQVRASGHVRVLVDDSPIYNFSRLNNAAVLEAQSDLTCFLNDDTEVIAPEWLAAMVARATEEDVAAVGAMLYFPNDTIQHAGIILGVGGIAAHAYAGSPRGSGGYHDRALLDQDVSCVTAACMLVRRQAFLDVGGFDEALAIAYNDVDLCLRLRQAGWRIVWTPSAELYHKESSSLGPHSVGSAEGGWLASRRIIESRWSRQLLEDPTYSPNLSLDRFEFWEPAFPPRVPLRPWSDAKPTRC